MLSSELIVRTVKNRLLLSEEPVHWRPSGFDFGPPIRNIPQSINYTLAFLNDLPVPYAGAQLVHRTLPMEPGRMAKAVETAIWPILRFESGRNVIELVMDAYGDLMGRIAREIPDGIEDPIRLRLLNPVDLQMQRSASVMLELHRLRDRLEEQFFSIQHSHV